MVKKFLPPLLALLGGGVGFALRNWQHTSGFEPDSGLAIPGAPAAWAVAGFSLGMLLLFFLLTRKVEKRLSWERAFGAGKGETLVPAVLMLGAMLLLASGGVELVTRSVNGLLTFEGETRFARTTSMILYYLRLILCVGALPAVFLWARALLRGEGGNECLGVLEPCLLYCVWLISTYQTRAADPVVQDYLYEVFAVVCSLLGFYFIAGHAFGNGKPRRCAFFCLAGAYFSLVTLADGHTLADTFRDLFAVFYLITHAALIMLCPPEEATSAKEETEEENHA